MIEIRDDVEEDDKDIITKELGNILDQSQKQAAHANKELSEVKDLLKA